MCDNARLCHEDATKANKYLPIQTSLDLLYIMTSNHHLHACFPGKLSIHTMLIQNTAEILLSAICGSQKQNNLRMILRVLNNSQIKKNQQDRHTKVSIRLFILEIGNRKNCDSLGERVGHLSL